MGRPVRPVKLKDSSKALSGESVASREKKLGGHQEPRALCFPALPGCTLTAPSSCQLARPASTSPAPLPSPTLHDFRCPAPTAGLPQIQAGLLSFPRETSLNKERLGAASRVVPWVCLQSLVAGRGRMHTQRRGVALEESAGLKQGPVGRGEFGRWKRGGTERHKTLEGSGERMLPTGQH